MWGLTQGPAEKPDSEQACAATTGRLGAGAQEGLGELGYLLWGEEEAISGPLSSINSRMESGWSHRLPDSALFFKHTWLAQAF